MTKTVILLLLFTLYFIVPKPLYSNTIYTICDGMWSDTSTWNNNSIPDSLDSIYVNNRVRFDNDITVNSNYAIIDTAGELCGYYDLNVAVGSLVINNGIIKGDFINVSGTLINNNIVQANKFGGSGIFVSNGISIAGGGYTCLAVINPCHKPIADFSISDTVICTGNCIKLTDSSNYDPSTWTWYFDNASTLNSTVQHPDGICYLNPGNYSIKLIVANAIGTDSIIKSITIGETYKDTINPIICFGEKYMFGSNTYTTSGIYSDTMIRSNGCDSIIIINLTVNTSFQDTNTYYLCDGDSVFVAGEFNLLSGYYFDSLTTIKGCDSTIVSSLLSLDSINSKNVITGVIYYRDTAIKSGIVKLLIKPRNSPRSITVVDSVNVNSKGAYTFSNIGTGEYLIKAKADTALYPNSVTTYADSTNHWQMSRKFTLRSACKDTLDSLNVYVIDFPTTIGNSSINGVLINNSRTISGNISNVELSLEEIKGPKITAVSVSNSIGEFSFDNVEKGNYLINVDIPGYYQDTLTVFNFTDTTKNYNIEICLNNDSNYVSVCEMTIDGILNLEFKSVFSIYPNPTNGYIIVSSLSNITSYQLNIMNLLGSVVLTENISNEVTHFLDLSYLSNGFYSISIKSSQNQSLFKLVKN